MYLLEKAEELVDQSLGRAQVWTLQMTPARI
jgi:hypothetical protein